MPALYPTIPMQRIRDRRRWKADEQAQAGVLRFQRNPAAAGARAGWAEQGRAAALSRGFGRTWSDAPTQAGYEERIYGGRLGMRVPTGSTQAIGAQGGGIETSPGANPMHAEAIKGSGLIWRGDAAASGLPRTVHGASPGGGYVRLTGSYPSVYEAAAEAPIPGETRLDVQGNPVAQAAPVAPLPGAGRAAMLGPAGGYAPGTDPNAWYNQTPAGGGPSYANLARMTRENAPLGMGHQAILEQMPSQDEFQSAGLRREMLGSEAAALPGALAAQTGEMQGRAAMLGEQARAMGLANEMQEMVLEQIKQNPEAFMQSMMGQSPWQQAQILAELAASMQETNPEMAARLNEYAAGMAVPGMPPPPTNWWRNFWKWFWQTLGAMRG